MSSKVLRPLGGGVKIYTDPVHSFGTDAVLLADFAAVKGDDIACDLGTGCGIIPLLWCSRRHPGRITAIDIRPEAIELARESVALNGLEDKIELEQADLRRFSRSGYTLVTMNPPYKRVGDGAVSPVEARAVARHEISCTVDDMARCAARLLKPSGRLCVCHRPERLSDLICAMRAAGVEPKRLREVCQRPGSSPSLILCEGRRSASPGMVIEPAFFIESETGGYSDPMAKIYSEFFKESVQ